MHLPSTQELENKTKPIYWDIFRIQATENIYFRIFWMDFMIPKWFISDGASLPFFMKMFMSKFNPKWLFAAIVHDYLYKTQFIPYRVMCDLIFKYILEDTWWIFISEIFYRWVRIWWWDWWQRNKSDLKKFPKVKHDLFKYQLELYNSD